jgi:hypothetical protein
VGGEEFRQSAPTLIIDRFVEIRAAGESLPDDFGYGLLHGWVDHGGGSHFPERPAAGAWRMVLRRLQIPSGAWRSQRGFRARILHSKSYPRSRRRTPAAKRVHDRFRRQSGEFVWPIAGLLAQPLNSSARSLILTDHRYDNLGLRREASASVPLTQVQIVLKQFASMRCVWPTGLLGKEV